MKKTRYTEEQIAFALRQEEAGTPVADIIRKRLCQNLPRHAT